MEFREMISSFVNWPIWSGVDTVFTIVGVVSVMLSIIRFFWNLKQPDWNEDALVTVYPSDYDVESDKKFVIYSETAKRDYGKDGGYVPGMTVFESRGVVIKKLELIELNTDEKATRIVEVFKNIEPDKCICFRIAHGECYAPYKLRWYTKYGDYGEYYFHFNLFNGNNDIGGVCSKKTVWSLIRRVIGFQ